MRPKWTVDNIYVLMYYYRFDHHTGGVITSKLYVHCNLCTVLRGGTIQTLEDITVSVNILNAFPTTVFPVLVQELCTWFVSTYYNG